MRKRHGAVSSWLSRFLLMQLGATIVLTAVAGSVADGGASENSDSNSGTDGGSNNGDSSGSNPLMTLQRSSRSISPCSQPPFELQCGSPFNFDIRSKALIADFIVRARAEKIGSPRIAFTAGPNAYYASFTILQILKDPDYSRNNIKQRVAIGKQIQVGFFGPYNPTFCLSELTPQADYILFLSQPIRKLGENSSAANILIYRLTALSESFTPKKADIIKTALNSSNWQRPVLEPDPLPSRRVLLGEKVILRCKVNRGYPSPIIRWFHNDKPLTDYRYCHGRNRSRSVLRVQVKSVEQAGRYECRSSNVLGNDSLSFLIQVDTEQKSENPQLISLLNFLRINAPEYSSGDMSAKNLSLYESLSNFIACSDQLYCYNGGLCLHHKHFDMNVCLCPLGYFTERCAESVTEVEAKIQDEMLRRYTRIGTIVGIALVAFLLLFCCIVGFVKSRHRRSDRETRRSQEKRERLVDEVRRNKHENRTNETALITNKTVQQNTTHNSINVAEKRIQPEATSASGPTSSPPSQRASTARATTVERELSVRSNQPRAQRNSASGCLERNRRDDAQDPLLHEPEPSGIVGRAGGSSGAYHRYSEVSVSTLGQSSSHLNSQNHSTSDVSAVTVEYRPRGVASVAPGTAQPHSASQTHLDDHGRVIPTAEHSRVVPTGGSKNRSELPYQQLPSSYNDEMTGQIAKEAHRLRQQLSDYDNLKDAVNEALGSELGSQDGGEMIFESVQRSSESSMADRERDMSLSLTSTECSQQLSPNMSRQNTEDEKAAEVTVEDVGDSDEPDDDTSRSECKHLRNNHRMLQDQILMKHPLFAGRYGANEPTRLQQVSSLKQPQEQPPQQQIQWSAPSSVARPVAPVTVRPIISQPAPVVQHPRMVQSARQARPHDVSQVTSSTSQLSAAVGPISQSEIKLPGDPPTPRRAATLPPGPRSSHLNSQAVVHGARGLPGRRLPRPPGARQPATYPIHPQGSRLPFGPILATGPHPVRFHSSMGAPARYEPPNETRISEPDPKQRSETSLPSGTTPTSMLKPTSSADSQPVHSPPTSVITTLPQQHRQTAPAQLPQLPATTGQMEHSMPQQTAPPQQTTPLHQSAPSHQIAPPGQHKVAGGPILGAVQRTPQSPKAGGEGSGPPRISTSTDNAASFQSHKFSNVRSQASRVPRPPPDPFASYPGVDTNTKPSIQQNWAGVSSPTTTTAQGRLPLQQPPQQQQRSASTERPTMDRVNGRSRSLGGFSDAGDDEPVVVGATPASSQSLFSRMAYQASTLPRPGQSILGGAKRLLGGTSTDTPAPAPTSQSTDQIETTPSTLAGSSNPLYAAIKKPFQWLPGQGNDSRGVGSTAASFFGVSRPSPATTLASSPPTSSASVSTSLPFAQPNSPPIRESDIL